jgi:2-polyprenyl-6-methoxyphenol hydroxylase-like FAD-dependent oxidoreductase
MRCRDIAVLMGCSQCRGPDGSKLEVDGSSDLRVIGADGIWSRCRKEMEAQTNLRVRTPYSLLVT